MNFAVLPNLVALAVLVAVFWAISRKATSQQVQLWLLGWILVLVHFAATVPVPTGEIWSRLTTILAVGSLILASTMFLISVASIAVNRRRQLELTIAVAVPALAYGSGVICGIDSPLYYYLLIALGTFAPLFLVWRYRRGDKLYLAGVALVGLLVAVVIAGQVAAGNPGLGIVSILATLNVATGLHYWRQHRRSTAGVLTTVCGFVLWGAVFPTAALLQLVAPSLKVDSEVWNIPKYLVAVGMILTLLEDQIQKSTFLAYHDELTDLPNRRLLQDRLDQSLAQAKRAGDKVAVFVLDLDRFKEVNDNFGHRVGDMTLQQVAARLGNRIRACDTLARSGGDEFTVVCQVSSEQSAAALLSALEAALSDPFVIEGKEVRTGLSIGLALYPDDGSDADQLCAAADRGMYVAKRSGRHSGSGVSIGRART
ncbi:MAG: GGDEF domain-containing protein [Candidatus Korobacteraceae bacterium]